MLFNFDFSTVIENLIFRQLPKMVLNKQQLQEMVLNQQLLSEMVLNQQQLPEMVLNQRQLYTDGPKPTSTTRDGKGGQPTPGVNGNWECDNCKNINYPRR